jgi:hypothetical protein
LAEGHGGVLTEILVLFSHNRDNHWTKVPTLGNEDIVLFLGVEKKS